MHRSLRPLLLASTLALVACAPNAQWNPLVTPGACGVTAVDPLPFEADDGNALDHDRVSAATSATLADLFVHVPYALLFAFAAFFTWHHNRRAVMERASNPNAPLVDGPAVVFGTVESNPDWQGPVVRLDIHQAGTEWCNKGSWHHQWRETNRTLNRRPFVVVRDDGVRVQIEPDERVILHDETDTVRHDLTTRTRVAAIEPGQRVHVSGTLAGASLAQSNVGGAYRGGYGMPSLRAPSIGRMVISNERPGEPALARMRFHRAWAIGIAALVAFLVSVVMPAFELLSLSNDLVWVTPTEARNWREWHKPKNSSGYWVYRYSLRGSYVDQGVTRVVEDDCGEAYHRYATERPCAPVPFTVSTIAPSWHQIGTGPQLTVGRCIMLGILCLTLLIVYPASVSASRPWYEKKRVVDSGNGRLTHH
jgi:hypothetical protein